MSKINNNQRVAFAKMIEEARSKFDRRSDGSIYINRYGDPFEGAEPRLLELLTSHGLDKLKAARVAAEAAYEKEFKCIQRKVEKVNAEFEAKRRLELQQFSDAIRDVWATDDADVAKEIVAGITRL